MAAHLSTDTSEKELERLIVDSLVEEGGYELGRPEDYSAELVLDTRQLLRFLYTTQPDTVHALELAKEGPKRAKFFQRLKEEIGRRGVVDVLRKGIKDKSHSVDLYKLLPSPGNQGAKDAFAQNQFGITRQLRYNQSSARALDLVIFINGLPVLTLELKNSLTRQTANDAITQYQTTRSPHELLFQPGRCIAHLAVDDTEVYFCPELKGKASRFLPFNQGFNCGAGNPPNPNGIKTDYLWKQILTKNSLANIIENFAQIVEEQVTVTGKNKTGKKTHTSIPPVSSTANGARPAPESL